MLKKVGLVQTYTGSGKGKSTSAFGLTFRAVGHGWNILVIQFMKGEDSDDKMYGELQACTQFKRNITVLQSHEGIPYKIVLENNKSGEDRLLLEKTWDAMEMELANGKEVNVFTGETEPYNMLVLDEILGSLNLGLIRQRVFFDFIKRIRTERPDLEIVMTGRIWSDTLYDKVKDISDLMSDLRCVKHYFEKTCPKCKRSFEFRSNFCPNCGGTLSTISSRKGVEN